MSHSLSIEGIPTGGNKQLAGHGSRIRHVMDDQSYHARLLEKRGYKGTFTDIVNGVQERLHRVGLLKDSVEVTVERLANLPRPDDRAIPPLLLVERLEPVFEIQAADEWDGTSGSLRAS